MLAETLLSVLGIPIVVVAYLLVSDKKEHGGQFFWRRSRLFSSGVATTGVVLDHAHHSEGWAGRIIVHTVDLVVEFELPGAAPIRVPLSYRLPVGAMSNMTEKGRSLPLRYDPSDPRVTVIDEPALWGLKSTNPSSAEREADKARQRALVRGDKT
jgi:hypothetical protein